jgi:DNA topoisomerase-1
MDKLIIVESPTKAKTLGKFLDSSFRIESTYGHVRDLPQKKLGIDIQEIKSESKVSFKFLPQYEIIKDRKMRVNELKKISKEAKEIYLATDPDREGEAISYHIHSILDGQRNKIKNSFFRIVFHEITKEAVLESLKNPHNIDSKMVDAQQARRILDRIVGYKLSPLLWNKLSKRWLSAGRVQSVAVRLIVEREREIQAFKPSEYWLVDVELSKNEKLFIARLVSLNGKKVDIKSAIQANECETDLNKATYKVKNINSKDTYRSPSPPFTTSTLQQAAVNRLGWSAKKTMRTAQNLYEEGLITYHRTDSTNIAQQAIDSVRDFIDKIYGEPYLPQSKKIYKTKSKVAQEAHEAIRPTNVFKISEKDYRNINKQKENQSNLTVLSADLGRDQEFLYSLIWRRFVASQMKDAVIKQRDVDINASQNDKNYLLKAQGQKLIFSGFLILGNDQKIDKELPDLYKDDMLKLNKVIPQQKFTEPPSRYNEASLIKILEEKGIGRPSTYAPIISTIQDRKYVEKIEKKFHPTDLGFAVNDFLIANFPDLFDVTFTARMEDNLDEIANGKLAWNDLISSFYGPFINKIDSVFKTAGKVKIDLGQTDEKCPQCGKALLVRISKYGKFLACSGYPDCKYKKNIIEKAGIICPQCQGEIIIKKTRRGKQFYGCMNYPKCKFAAWKKDDIVSVKN